MRKKIQQLEIENETLKWIVELYRSDFRWLLSLQDMVLREATTLTHNEIKRIQIDTLKYIEERIRCNILRDPLDIVCKCIKELEEK